jgi:hypothetical protein
MVTARAQAQLSVKSFSSCFLGYRAQVLLLRLFSFTVVIHVPHRRYPASCAKKLVRSGRAFLHPQITQNRLLMRESMTLRHFGGQFACFSAKDIYKVWRGGGLYSGWLCGTVYTINLQVANMNPIDVDALREKEFEHGLFL